MSIQTVSLSIVESAPYIINTIITITANTQPLATPLGMYVWTNEKDELIQEGVGLSSISYTIPDGKFAKLVKLTVIDGTNAYSAQIRIITKYQEGALTPATPPIGISRRRNNLELHKFLSSFPKWSFANQSFLSNAAKISEPAFNRLMETQAYAVYMAAANMMNGATTTEFLSKMFKVPFVKEPKEIITDVGVFENSGMAIENWFDSYPITNAYLMPAKIFNFTYRYVPDAPFVRFSMPLETKLNITTTDNEASEMALVGINSKGKVIKESLSVLPHVSSTTVNRYRMIIGVYSNSSIDISTTPKTDSYRSGYVDFKRIVGMNGVYFEPKFVIDETDKNVIVVQNGVKDEYRFTLPHIIDKFLVTENLDIIYLSGDSLYCSKPYLDTRLNIGITSTFNNNEICSSNGSDVVAGGEVVFSVNNDKIKKLSSLFYLRINDQYVDIYGNILASKKSINAKDVPDVFLIKKTKQDSENIILSVEIENIEEVFQCGTISNKIDSYLILNNVLDVLSYNGKVHIQTISNHNEIIDSYNSYVYPSYIIDEDFNKVLTTSIDKSNINTFELIPIRSCFLIQGGEILFNTKINILEYVYD